MIKKNSAERKTSSQKLNLLGGTEDSDDEK